MFALQYCTSTYFYSTSLYVLTVWEWNRSDRRRLCWFMLHHAEVANSMTGFNNKFLLHIILEIGNCEL